MSDKSTLGEVWKRGQHGWPARFPLVQFPNAPLLVALAGSLVAMFTDDTVHDYARGAFFAGLAGWAWMELLSGVNWVRRLVGAGGIVYVVVKIARALGA